MTDVVLQENISIKAGEYIYRTVHRIMEGDCQYDHGPRLVKVPDLLVDKYPVTNFMFSEFLRQSGYQPKDAAHFLEHWNGKELPRHLENLPVVFVSQTDAQAYAEYYGRRLPYDYEWQWIAGGVKKTAYPWGNSFDSARCNAHGDSFTPVDFYPNGASLSGCMDMCGNAWEMVADRIDDGMHHFTFLRGGCRYKAPHYWHAEGGPHKTDFHLKMPLLNEALNRNSTVGFRTVKDVAHI